MIVITFNRATFFTPEDNHDCSSTTTLAAPYFLSGTAQYYPRYHRAYYSIFSFLSLLFSCCPGTRIWASNSPSHRSAFSVSPSPFFLVFVIMPGTPVTLKRENFGGQLMIASRSLLREVKTTLPDSASVREFARLQIAFAHCLRMTLRKQPQAEVLAHYLKTEDLQPVLASNSPANRILLIMGGVVGGSAPQWAAFRYPVY